MSGKITKEQIPDKIKKLMGKGCPQKQAVAIAYEMWRDIELWLSQDMPEEDAIRLAITKWEAAHSEPRQENRRLFSTRAVSIVNEVEGIIRGYIAIWGDSAHRDSYETWFDPARPPEMNLDLLPVAIYYEHGQDGGVRKERVGEIYEAGFDDTGIFFEGQLDRSAPYFARVIEELRHGTNNGALRTSSGTMPYLAEFYPDGAFKSWPLGEVSLTSIPSESRMPDVELIRSEQTDAATGRQEAAADLIPETNKPIVESGVDGESLTLTNENEDSPMKEKVQAVLDSLGEGATLEDFMAALVAAGFAVEEMMQAVEMMGKPEVEQALSLPQDATDNQRFAAALSGVMAKKEVEQQAQAVNENRALRGQLALLRTQQAAKPVETGNRQRGDSTGDNGHGVRITDMHDLRFDHLNAKQMALGYLLLRASHRPHTAAYNTPVSEDYYRAMRSKVMDRVKLGSDRWHDSSNFYAARNAAFRANEVMSVTSASQEGYDWIGTYYPSELWEVARASRIMDAVEAAGLWVIEIPDGQHSAVVPLEGSDPTWYSAAAAISVDTTTFTSLPLVDETQITTANTTVTPGKAMMRILVATELIEDSVIPILAQLDRQADESAQNQIEYLFLNADSDTTASTNINLIDGTPGTGISAPSYLVTDGVLKYALVTGSSTSRDGATFDSTDFLKTQGLLPVANSADPEKLLFVSDIKTRLKAMEFTDLKTYSEQEDGGTIKTGRINMIYGVQYLASAQMATANSAGKIPAAGAALGRLACIYAPYWAMVWKRHITFKTAEDIEGDVTKIVGSMRLAFKARGAGASTVTYNLTIT